VVNCDYIVRDLSWTDPCGLELHHTWGYPICRLYQHDVERQSHEIQAPRYITQYLRMLETRDLRLSPDIRMAPHHLKESESLVATGQVKYLSE
jgi:hypothetical protein